MARWRMLCVVASVSFLFVAASPVQHWQHCSEAAFRGAWKRMDPSQLPPEPQIHMRGTRPDDKDDHWLWVWNPVPEDCPQPRVLTQLETIDCWKQKHVVFMGDSTTREMCERETKLVGASASLLRCNRTMGYGCFDCVRGCRNGHNWDARYWDWTDVGMAPDYLLEFSWKPDMFTTDDLIRLKHLHADQRRHPIDAFVVSKGLHDVMNWYDKMIYRQHRDTKGQPMEVAFWEEIEERAKELANTLRLMFPHVRLFWRDAFFNLLQPEAETLLEVVRNRTNKYFKAAGFVIISGHDLNYGIPPRGIDPIHPLQAVYDVVSTGVKYSLCHPQLAQN